MKKYLRLSCTVCKRSADRLVDNTHFTPDKCTITFKCEGRLFPIEYRSDGGITSAPAVGITDWRPRNSVVTGAATAQGESLVNTSTGSTQQVVLAVKASVSPPIGSTLSLVLNERNDTPKNYKQYVYRLESSFTSVSGVESGLEKKTLRYATTDIIEVYLNGVKQEQGVLPENYEVYDGTITSAVPPNTVKFNSVIALPGITQVDVIVSGAVPTTQATLVFDRNESDESRLGTGAWENIDFVKFFEGGVWEPYYLFTLDLSNATALSLNSILTATPTVFISTGPIIPSTDVKLLLARAPYSMLDRYLNLWVPLDTLSFERDYFKFAPVNGRAVLNVTQTSVQTVFPILQILQAQKFTVEKTIQTKLDGVDEQVIIDGSVIVGPDA